MKTFHKNTFSILLLLFFLFSCQSDDNSNELAYSETDLRILIVGNSITHHSPAPNLGWYGDWGMAASAPDKDFKSVYTQKLEKYLSKRKVFVSSKNISAWENDFNYNLNEYVDISNKVYDILIVRLGENVGTQSYQLSNYGYALKQMINHFKTSDTKVIITGNI